MNPEDIKARRYWTLLFTAVYTASYITRINYGAVILEMARDTGWTNGVLSAALTGSFVTYGIGQLVSGRLGDRFQPGRLVFAGLAVSGLMNILIPLCPSAAAMTAVWCVNGFFQSFLWPPIVRLMVNIFPAEEYSRVTILVCLGSPVGTMLTYLLSPVWIGLWGWRSVFFISALCGEAMALLWLFRGPKIAPAPPKTGGERGKDACISPMLAVIMLAITVQGVLRDGVSTWMPTYISESYDLGSRVSILTGVVMPLFAMLCYRAAGTVNRHFPGNPLVSAGIFFGVSTASAVVLDLLAGQQVLGSVLCFALLTGCMHGANLMLIGMIPAFYRKTGHVSFISGLLNACTYVGSALSTYGIARLAETAGWGFTVKTWVFLALAGGLLCICSIPAWRRRFTGRENK